MWASVSKRLRTAGLTFIDPRHLTGLSSVQHQPADGNVTVTKTVEQFGNVVQDDFFSQESLLQQLLHLRPQTLHTGSVSTGLRGENNDCV